MGIATVKKSLPNGVLEQIENEAVQRYPYSPVEGNAYHNSMNEKETDAKRASFIDAAVWGFNLSTNKG